MSDKKGIGLYAHIYGVHRCLTLVKPRSSPRVWLQTVWCSPTHTTWGGSPPKPRQDQAFLQLLSWTQSICKVRSDRHGCPEWPDETQ